MNLQPANRGHIFINYVLAKLQKFHNNLGG